MNTLNLIHGAAPEVPTIGSKDFTNQKPFVVTREDCAKPWSGGENGRYFRCHLCGHKFQPGDVVRWQFTNDTPGAGGNPMVCQKCDGAKEEIVAKLKALRAEFEAPRFWSLRRVIGERSARHFDAPAGACPNMPLQ